MRKHWRKPAGFDVAVSGDCLKVQDDETEGKVPGRAFRAHTPATLGGFRPPRSRSWSMGILLCPGDDVQPILTWTGGLSAAEAERVVFYVHPRFDRAMMASWHASARPRLVPLHGSWRDFHRLYGRHHADRVYQDHGLTSGSG